MLSLLLRPSEREGGRPILTYASRLAGLAIKDVTAKRWLGHVEGARSHPDGSRGFSERETCDGGHCFVSAWRKQMVDACVRAKIRRIPFWRIFQKSNRGAITEPIITHDTSLAMASNAIGFIGLGQMGGRMLANLTKKGHKVVAFDLSPAALDSAKGAGASVAASVTEVAEGCPTVITMLPSTPHVEGTYKDAGGLLPTAAASGGSDDSRLFIDCSTIDPVASKALHGATAAAGAGFRMLDAPVSGGVGGAEAGTLTFMVGGEADALEDAMPLFEAMGSNVVHCGAAGTGEVAKLCNNLSLAVSMVGTCEAMNLGAQLGIDPKVLASIMNTSTARCWSSDTYNPCPGVMEGVPSSRGYSGGFANGLMEKDLHLALGAGRAAQAPLPLGSQAHAIYSLMKANGHEELDFSSVYLLLNGHFNGKAEK